MSQDECNNEGKVSTSTPLGAQEFQLDSSDLAPKSPPRPLKPNVLNGERNEFRQGSNAQQFAQTFDNQPNVQQFVQQNLHNTGFSQQIEAHGGFDRPQNAPLQLNGLPQNAQGALNSGAQLAGFPHDEGTGQLGLFGAQLSNVPQVPDSQTSSDLQQGAAPSGSLFAPQSSSVNSLSFDGNGQSNGQGQEIETAPTSLQVHLCTKLALSSHCL